MKQEGKQKPRRKKPSKTTCTHSKTTLQGNFYVYRLLGLKFPLCEVSIHNSGASSQVLFAAELIPSLFLD